MKTIRRLLHNLFHKNKPGGLVMESVGDGASPKFKRYREKYAKDIFGATFPETLGRAEKIMMDDEYPNKMFCFQNSILSCVSCSVVEVKNFFTNFKSFFSWRWIYGRVEHLPGGTRFKDNMKVAKEGMLLDAFMPQRNYWGGEMKMQVLNFLRNGFFRRVNDEELLKLKKLARKNTLDASWSYVYTKDITAIKHAVTKAPCPTGVYVQSGNWYWKKGVINWIKGKAGSFGHLIVIFDWNDKERCWIVSDHDAQGFKKLSYDYPLSFVASVEDGKTGEEEKNMLKVIKTTDNPDFYVVFADNTKSHIPTWDLFMWGFTKGFWVGADNVEIVKEEDFARIPTDKDNNHLLSIMNEFNQSNKN